MGVENESRFIVAFDGQSGNLDQILSALKSQFRATVSDLQKTANSLDLYSELLKQNGAVVSAVSDTRKRFEDLKAAVEAIKNAGGTVGKELAASLKEAEKAATAAVKGYRDHRDALQEMRKSLSSAGVDVKSLAAEQLRLAESIRVANAAAVQQSNRDLLGVKNIQPQIAQLNAAFRSLVESGKASMGEVSLAAANLQTKVAALKEETGGAGAAFTALKGHLFAIVATVGAVSLAATKAASDFRAFAQGMAAIQTIAETSKERVDQLAQGVRRLSRDMGVDAVNSTKALYDIIGSGISQENSLKVLELSSKAAVAGLTDVGTAAKLGVSILNAYGLEVGQLENVYDVLFKTVRDGVVTFPELAASIGDVLPTARSARVPLTEVGAAMVLLTKNGINAAESSTALTRSIQDLAAPGPEASESMRKLGITFDGLTNTIEQLAKKSLTLGQLRELIPDVRAVKGVQVLMQNYEALRKEVDSLQDSANTMQAAYAIMAATPQANIDRFQAAIKDLALSVGNFIAGSAGFIKFLTDTINAFNNLAPATRSSIIEIVAIGAAFGAAFLIISKLAVPLNLLGASLLAGAGAATIFGQAVTLSSLAMIGLQAALAGFLGFQFGKQLSENSENVRFFGDLLGVAAGRVDNLATFLSARLSAALSGNAAAADQAREAYRLNLATLNEMQVAIETGVTAKLYNLQKQFEALTKQLGEASLASIKAASDVQSGVGAIAIAVKNELDAVNTTIDRLTGNLQSLVAKLAENVKAAQDAAAAAIANINAEAAARTAALSKNAADELASGKALAEIQATLFKDRLKAIEDNSKEIVKAFETESAARIDIAKRTTKNTAAVEQEILVTKRGILQTIVNEYRAHIAELNKQDADRLSKIKDLEQERANIKLSFEDKIREINRQGLSAIDQYYDKAKQADELLSKAREASAKGNLKLAEEYANRAVALADNLSKEVKEGGEIIVSAQDAGAEATRRYQSAQSILLGVVDKRIAAEKQGQEATRTALEAAKAGLADFSKQLSDVSAKAAKGMEIQVTANTTAVKETLAKLETEIKSQETLMKVNADVKLAKETIAELKKDLDKGVTANVKANTDDITAALERIQKTKPELSVSVDTALGNIEKVREAAAKISNIQMQIKSNVGEVQTAINALKADTSSTHTVYIKKVETNATGGPVGVSVPGYAGGGSVGFTPPTYNRVPGNGSGDTVPALLKRGSFVVRKAASRYYGDELMQSIARGYASGGPIGDDAPLRMATGGNPWKVKKTPPADIDGIPSTAIIGYAQGLLPYLRHPMFVNVPPLIAELLKQWQGSGGKAKGALRQMLDVARNVAANYHLQAFYGKSISGGGVSNYKPLTSFEDFYARWKIQHEKDQEETDDDIEETVKKAIETFARSAGPAKTGFAEGGSPRDTVRAMLEPGEYVMQVPSVRKYGEGLMHMINHMMIPRDQLRAMVAPPRGYATGGPVLPMRPASTSPAGASAPGGIAVTIQANAGDILSAENVRRFIVPALDDIMRRSRR